MEPLRSSPGPLPVGALTRTRTQLLLEAVVPRPRTHMTGPRARQILIRVTEEAHAGLALKARSAGLSVSGLCERLVTQGKLEVISAANAELHPAVFAELRRIGNNINQLAHAANGLMPPDVRMMVGNFNKLFKLLIQNELIARRMNEDLRTGSTANDSAPPSSRDQFQRSVQLRTARRGSDDR